ncbi:serine hydrolase domain-containing protein [uncultured Sphingomonas sp.]|uniref:serine hydrolase domain-containing protein n=1 Tax=uncultured Sphingomonas sp. TaxID=158754 RepID=UPI0035CA82A5
MMRLVGLATAAGMLVALALAAAPARPAATATALPATQALFSSYVADDKMPGIVGAFGAGDRPTVFVSAGRIADEGDAPAAGPDSLWRVYSMTKPVTAMAAMILIEQGRMRLDQPVSDFIPEFKEMRVQLNPNTIDSRPALRPITIRHLLTHTAGLGYNIITTGPLLRLYESKGLLPGAFNVAMETRMRQLRPTSLQEFARRVAGVPLVADPGTTWRYSMGLDVLAAVIEKAGGMPFDAFVQRRIFDPLGMKSSYWTVPGGAAGRLATTYSFVAGRRIPIDPGATSVFLQPPSFPYGGAGLVMSARDYDRFLHMLQDLGTLDGVTIMRPETARLAMSDLLPPGVRFTSVPGETGGVAGPQMGYGAGGAVILKDANNAFGAGTYAWGGAAGTHAWVNAVRKLRGTIMVNYLPATQWPVRDQTIRALAADLAPRSTR